MALSSITSGFAPPIAYKSIEAPVSPGIAAVKPPPPPPDAPLPAVEPKPAPVNTPAADGIAQVVDGAAKTVRTLETLGASLTPAPASKGRSIPENSIEKQLADPGPKASAITVPGLKLQAAAQDMARSIQQGVRIAVGDLDGDSLPDAASGKTPSLAINLSTRQFHSMSKSIIQNIRA